MEVTQEVRVHGARVGTDDEHVVAERDGGMKDLTVLLGAPAEAVPEGVVVGKEETALGTTS